MSKKYQVIYADPPWPEKGHGDKLGGYKITKLALDHYNVMTADEIKALPIQNLISPAGAILFLWTPFRHIQLALDVITAWGFTYKTIGFIWVKMTISEPIRPIYGPGFHTASNAEPCLLATSGRVPRPGGGHRPSVVLEPRREHSRKPDTVAERIEKTYKKMRKLELFSRYPRKGWDSWGNEIESDIKL